MHSCFQIPFSENNSVKPKKSILQPQAGRKPKKKKEADNEGNESASTEKGHDAQLKKEMAARKPDEKKIYALLKVSLQTRRKWINGLTGKGAVKKVLQEYPGFKQYKQVNCK